MLHHAQKDQSIVEGISLPPSEELTAAATQRAYHEFEKVMKHVEFATTYIQYHRIAIPGTGIAFQRLTLYDELPDTATALSWDMDEAIATSLLFAQQELDVTPPRELTFVSIGLANYPTFTTHAQTAVPLSYSNELQQLMQHGGQAYPKDSIALLYETAKRKSTKDSPSLGKKFIMRHNLATARHEGGHLIDPNVLFATSAQAEGFARAFQYNFDFSACLRVLQKTHKYTRFPSQGHLEYLFAVPSATQRLAPEVERYPLAATFFAHLYETYGAKVMMDWYGYISGRSAYTQTDTTLTFVSTKGNLMNSLTQALRDNKHALPDDKKEDSADDVISGYIERVGKTANPDTVAPYAMSKENEEELVA